MPKEISNTEMVVSFLNLYIQDEEIMRKLAELIFQLKRKMWPGTDIIDGTRFLKVKFTDTVKSLPYTQQNLRRWEEESIFESPMTDR